MFQILRQEEKDNYIDLIRSLGIDPDTALISEAVDSGKVTGYAVYTLTPEEISVYCVEPEADLVLWDGIARSILFSAVLKGVETARFFGSANNNAKMLRFTEPGSDELRPISKIFEGCKDCKHAKE